MTKGIDLSVAADTRSAMSAINKGLIDPLDDVAELLERVGKDGDDATTDIERGMRNAQRRTDDAKDEIKDLRDELRNAGRSGKSAGDDIDDGMRKGKRGIEELGEEANSTARESAASFDGSAESIGDAFQEIAANAFAGFGPAGAVAGLAAAAGIGLAVAGFEATAEAQAASEERTAAWADRYIEAGGRIIDASSIIAETVAIATDPERYKVAAENAANWGVTEQTALRAMAGDATSLTVVQETLNAKKERWAEVLARTTTGAELSKLELIDLTKAERDLYDEIEAGSSAWSTLTGEMADGESRARTVSAALRGIVSDATDATVQVDDLGNKLYTLPDETQVLIDAKTGQATQNVAGFKGKLDEIPATKAVLVNGTVQLDDSVIRNYRPPRITVQGDLVVNGKRALIQ